MPTSTLMHSHKNAVILSEAKDPPRKKAPLIPKNNSPQHLLTPAVIARLTAQAVAIRSLNPICLQQFPFP